MRHTLSVGSMKAHLRTQKSTTATREPWTQDDYEKAKKDGYRLAYSRDGYQILPFDDTAAQNLAENHWDSPQDLVLYRHAHGCRTAARAIELATQ
jgi:hypothetical protein